MKKVLLLCLTALMCCVTGAWALSGSGSQSDPYILQDGDQFTVNGGTMYAEFTAPENGVLRIHQEYYQNCQVAIKEKGSSTDPVAGEWIVGSQMYYEFEVAGGKTYELSNQVEFPAFEVNMEVEFFNPEDLMFNIVNVEPAEGSALPNCAEGETALKITIDKPVAYMSVVIDGGIEDEWMNTEVSAQPVGEGTPVLDAEGNQVIFTDRTDPENTYPLMAYTEWTVGPEFIKAGMTNDWTFYEGGEYNFTFKSYEDRNGWYDMNPLHEVTLTYTGATPAPSYSDIVLESITPSIDASDPKDMPSSENPVVRFTFSGLVDVTEVGNALGQGMGLVPLAYEVVDEGGKTNVDVTLEGGSNNSYITVYIAVKDRNTGEMLNDKSGDFAGYFSKGTSSYTVDVPWADGRTIDYLLTVENSDPKDGAYVKSLDKVAFSVAGAADADGMYNITWMGNVGGVYNEAGEKVYDVLLQRADPNDYLGNEFEAVICNLGSVNQEWGEGTPVTITEPGVYTVKVDSMAIGDGNFDFSNPWQTDQGGFTKGRCNPTWYWTINVVDEIVAVESIDPAPYEVGGEFNSEIPAEIKITMSSPNFKVNAATARFGMNQRIPLNYSVESGNTLVVTVADENLEALQAEKQVTFTVSATSNSGAPIVYGEQGEETQSIVLVYQTDRASFIPVSTTPEADSHVSEISDITLDFGEPITIMYDSQVTLTDAEGEEIACSFDYDSDWSLMNLMHVYPTSTIVEDGAYTLTLPEKTVFSSNYNFGYVDEYGNPEGDLYNPELTYVFYVGEETGITAIKTDADGNVKVYTIDGVYVGTGKAADMLNSLPAGVYIVNGTKIAVK